MSKLVRQFVCDARGTCEEFLDEKYDPVKIGFDHWMSLWLINRSLKMNTPGHFRLFYERTNCRG